MGLLQDYQPTRLQMFLLACVCVILGGELWRISSESASPTASAQSLVALNPDNYIVQRYAEQLELAPALERYDQVLLALDQYFRDRGAYPATLSQLVPEYLAREPTIYIGYGEQLHYALAADGPAPGFDFWIYGHYPGAASMHGWFVKYCPIERDLCGEIHNRHSAPSRINPRWIWVSSSAL
ncbi:MAG TPA: hypothetical protein VGE07_17560 [Herpetosiphonaceae bacterium]